MPAISVILPVYNSASFLRKAMDSILAQTFTDFELIVVNDGSTDSSEQIINTYQDARICYIKNEKNQGLIFSLNRAIDLAKGEYLARMDADDICYPERFATQKEWLDKHPATAIVASFSSQIDKNGVMLGFFEPDRRFVTANQIRKKMPEQNCITHPSVMGRTAIFKSYKYAAEQQNIEDYDLWLRILAAGGIIEKVPKSLLLYRVHDTSITQTKLRRNNFFLKHFHCKRRFLAARIKQGKFNKFDLSVIVQMLLDLVKALGKSIKRTLIRK